MLPSITLDECITPGTPSEFVAAAVVLEWSSLKIKSISVMLHSWKRISLL